MRMLLLLTRALLWLDVIALLCIGVWLMVTSHVQNRRESRR